MNIRYTLFTKSWTMPIYDLGIFTKKIGFDGIELPVRSGFQVEPVNVSNDLPKAARVLRNLGLKISSIAGQTDEATIAACADADIPVIRICVKIPEDKNYFSAIEDYWHEWDTIVPLLDKYGVAIGVQNHCYRCISTTMQLRHAIQRYDPKHICAVWDLAHNALQGEDINSALDIIWPYLRIVNFKNGYWKRTSEVDKVHWDVFWTNGRDGRASWSHAVNELKKRNYKGDICLSAEYSDMKSVNNLIKEDLQYVKSLFI